MLGVFREEGEYGGFFANLARLSKNASKISIRLEGLANVFCYIETGGSFHINGN